MIQIIFEYLKKEKKKKKKKNRQTNKQKKSTINLHEEINHASKFSSCIRFVGYAFHGQCRSIFTNFHHTKTVFGACITTDGPKQPSFKITIQPDPVKPGEDVDFTISGSVPFDINEEVMIQI